jgi:hypothetical protein
MTGFDVIARAVRHYGQTITRRFYRRVRVFVEL